MCRKCCPGTPNKKTFAVAYKINNYFTRNALETMTRAGTPSYMSPQVAGRQPYDFRADVWSLGWVFYNLMTLQIPIVDPLEFVPPIPSEVPIPHSQFVLLRNCIFSKMIVVEQNQRGFVSDVIADKAFDNFYHSAESKAVSWEYQEAIECMSDRILEENHSQLQEKVERVDRKVEKKSQTTDDIKQLEKKLLDEISKRQKLEETVELLTKKNKELEQKFDSFQRQMREEIQRHLQQISSEDSPSKIYSGRSKPTSDKASFMKFWTLNF